MIVLYRDFFLDKRREKERLEADMKRMVTLKAVIPAGEAKPIAPLSVILSQFYLNLAEFCTHFNKETSQWEEGVELSVKVKKGLRAKEYKLFINPPPLTFYIYNAFDETTDQLTYLSLWDIVRIKARELKLTEPRAARCVFASLGSFSFHFYISFEINN